MMNEFYFDFVIVGGGQASIPLAHSLAQSGKRILLVERKNIGGSCINFGCTPTKAAIASAKLAHQARRAAEYGIKIPAVEIDFSDVIGKANQIASISREGLEKDLKTSSSISYLKGHARLDGRDEGGHFRIRIQDGPSVSCEQVILNTGNRSSIPKIPGLDTIRDRVLDADTWLQSHRQYPDKSPPKRIAMLGSGYVGLEMAQFYRRMGSSVVVIGRGPRIAKNEDTDISEALQRYLSKEGIEFYLDWGIQRVEARKVEGKDDGILIHGINPVSKKESMIEASHLFIAAGRIPNTGDLGLETVGIKTSPGGLVPINEKLSTQVQGIWVAGDIRGGPMFTHTSWDDFRILESQILGDRSRTTKRIVPYAMFTDPELGRVGMTEAEAKKSGRKYTVAKFDFADNGKANELRETQGFIKLIADVEKDELLGAAVLGAEGAELVQLYVTLMNARAPYSVIRDAIYIHPTLCEAIQSAVAKLADRKGLEGELGHRVA
jgi:pyruvate/2-oxoglutarate dehydrogenase complex dihydrolipoamide dehydrogenase (E3) component